MAPCVPPALSALTFCTITRTTVGSPTAGAFQLMVGAVPTPARFPNASRPATCTPTSGVRVGSALKRRGVSHEATSPKTCALEVAPGAFTSTLKLEPTTAQSGQYGAPEAALRGLSWTA